MQTADYDVLIIGGGLVGISLALALSNQAIKVALVEAKPENYAAIDTRALALSLSTQRIFTTLNVWQHLLADATPIQEIHVSDKGHFGAARLLAQQHEVEAFGYVIQADKLLAALKSQLLSKTDIEQIYSAQLQAFEVQNAQVKVHIKQDETIKTLTAKLVVAADGTNSKIRELANIPAQNTAHGQQALVASVVLAQEHHNRAYERFTGKGAIAFLPMQGRNGTLVWTFPKNDTIAQASDTVLLQQLQNHFGYRLGRFLTLTYKQTYPLNSKHAQEVIKQGLVLIGNAAQTLHPIAAQGFNLGLRDAACLAEVIVEAIKHQQNPGDLTLLTQYQHWRQSDQQQTLAFTNGLIRIFGNSFFPLTQLRDMGLFAFDNLPFAKQYLAQKNMGLLGRLPKLACGIPLV